VAIGLPHGYAQATFVKLFQRGFDRIARFALGAGTDCIARLPGGVDSRL